MKLIFLIGMPAAGKTYWGRKIAKEHGLQFIDLDVAVAAQEQASISALFATYGENGFREREHKYLKKLIPGIDEDTVISCGGGTPCFFNNMELMKAAGKVVYIKADIPTLLLHLAESDEVRPLLRGRGDMATYLEGMLKKRKAFYEQAHHILLSKDISLTTFAEIISHV